MSGDLIYTVIIDHETGRITPVSNMRSVADMLLMLNALDHIASGIRQALYDVFEKAEQRAAAPPIPETQEE